MPYVYRSNQPQSRSIPSIWGWLPASDSIWTSLTCLCLSTTHLPTSDDCWVKKVALECEWFSGHKEKTHIDFSPSTSAWPRHTCLHVCQILTAMTWQVNCGHFWTPSLSRVVSHSDHVKDVVFHQVVALDKESRVTSILRLRITFTWHSKWMD